MAGIRIRIRIRFPPSYPPLEPHIDSLYLIYIEQLVWYG